MQKKTERKRKADFLEVVASRDPSLRGSRRILSQVFTLYRQSLIRPGTLKSDMVQEFEAPRYQMDANANPL